MVGKHGSTIIQLNYSVDSAVPQSYVMPVDHYLEVNIQVSWRTSQKEGKLHSGFMTITSVCICGAPHETDGLQQNSRDVGVIC